MTPVLPDPHAAHALLLPLLLLQASAMSEEEDETAYRNCKPVVPLIAGGMPAAPSTPEPSTSGAGEGGQQLLRPHCRILYCNEQVGRRGGEGWGVWVCCGYMCVTGTGVEVDCGCGWGASGG